MNNCKQPATRLNYPVTKKGNQVDDYFGTKVADPYRWLENDTSAETKAWVKTEQKFTEDYLRRVMISTDFDNLKKLRQCFPLLTDSDLYPSIFSTLEDDDSTLELIDHYSSEDLVNWLRKSDVMGKACDRCLEDVITRLLELEVPLLKDDVWKIFKRQCENLDRGDNLLEKLSYSLKLVDRCPEAIGIIEDILNNELDFSDDSIVETLERFVEFYGSMQFRIYARKLGLFERFHEDQEAIDYLKNLC